MEYLLSGPENDRDLFLEIEGVGLELCDGGLAYECMDALKLCEALQHNAPNTELRFQIQRIASFVLLASYAGDKER